MTEIVAFRPVALQGLEPAKRHILERWAESPTALAPASMIAAEQRPILAAQIQQELEGAIGLSRARRAAIGLMACYPTNNIAVPEAWTQAVAEELADFPETVVREALRAVRRAVKFMPAVAEIVDACERSTGERLRALRALEAMDRHDAEREREAALERERRAWSEAHRAWSVRAAAALGASGAGLVPAELSSTWVRIAAFIVKAEVDWTVEDWQIAAESGEEWAGTLAVRVARGPGAWDGDRVLTAIKSARS